MNFGLDFSFLVIRNAEIESRLMQDPCLGDPNNLGIEYGRKRGRIETQERAHETDKT